MIHNEFTIIDPEKNHQSTMIDYELVPLHMRGSSGDFSQRLHQSKALNGTEDTSLGRRGC